MRGRLFHVEGDLYEWRQEPALAATLYVRVAPGEDGRLGIVELRVVGTPTSELLRSIPMGRIEAAANATHALDRGWEPASTTPHSRPRGSRIPSRLRNTAGGGRADEFYAAVAGVYRELAQSSSRPAIELAEANDVPVTTAHRWIKEARKRGYLGPGRPGKAG